MTPRSLDLSRGRGLTDPYHRVADLDEATRRILVRRSDFLALGVRRLAVFGSFANASAGPESDIDVLVEFEPGAKTLARLLALADLLEAILGRHVDLVTREGLSPHVGPHILAEARDVLRVA